MRTLIKLFSVLLTLSLLASCGPGMQFVKKDKDGKIVEKNEVKANFFTNPMDMEALRRGEQGHAVAELGNSITGLYNIIIQDYKNAQNPDSGKIQKQVVDDKLITLALTSMEVYGRLFAQPDDDKVHKRVETRSNSIAGSMITKAGNGNSRSIKQIPGFSYEKGAYFWDKYDPHHQHRLSPSDVKTLYSNPKGTYATGLKKILNDKYSK